MSVSVIVPTLNEERRIVPLVEQIHTFGSEVIKEILVADAARSSDRTLEVLQGQEKVFAFQSSATSRASQMNEAAQKAQGDVLYFVHADVVPPSSCIQDLNGAIDSGYDFGFFSYQFNSDNPLLKINSYCTRFDGLFTGGGDQTFFIKRQVFQEMGGFTQDLTFMEDYDFFWRLKKENYRYTIIKKNVLVSPRKYEGNSWVKVNALNLCVLTLFRLGFCPKKLKKMYQWVLS